jgi:hypothetical protein
MIPATAMPYQAADCVPACLGRPNFPLPAEQVTVEVEGRLLIGDHEINPARGAGRIRAGYNGYLPVWRTPPTPDPALLDASEMTDHEQAGVHRQAQRVR